MRELFEYHLAVGELFEFDSMYKIWYKFLFLVEIKNKVLSTYGC